MTTVREVLAQLKGVTKTGNRYMALCPWHEDKKPSLSISEGDGGKVLTHCYAGCTPEQVWSALHLTGNGNGRREVAAYDYCDETGKLLYQSVRLEPKDFRVRRPDGNGGWEWNLNGTRRVLYGLPGLLKADPSRTVIIPEGEKDADNLAKLGLIATTNIGGAGKWRDEYNEPLRGRKVAIFSDNDEPGRNHAQQVAESLYGIASSVKVAELPGLPDKGDVTDWLAQGNGIKELRELVEAAPEFESKVVESKSTDGLSIVKMADVAPESVEWFWHPYIPKKKITIIEGEEGLGKSWLTLAIVTANSRGRGLPTCGPFGAGTSLLMSAEDGLGDTVRPRLEGMGADLDRIFAVDEPLTLDEKGILRLKAAVLEYKPNLLVIDPLFAYVGGRLDINSANQSRAISARLAAIADERNLAVVTVRHIGKSRGLGDPRAAGLGSIDWRAAARSVLLAGWDRETNERGFVQTKNNLAEHGPAIGFSLVGGEFSWTSSCSLTFAGILQQSSNESERRAQADVAAVLHDLLSEGGKPAKETQREMRAAGFNDYQIRGARERLGVKPRREGFGTGSEWIWALPEVAKDNEDAAEDACKLETSHLRVNRDDKSTYSNNLAEDAKNNKSTHLRGYVPTFDDPERQREWDSWESGKGIS